MSVWDTAGAECNSSIAMSFRIPPSLPYLRNPRFLGRETELLRFEQITRGQKSPDSKTVAVLYGLGGTGKTEIALEFAYRSMSRYTAVFWLDAGTEESLHNGFVEIAQSLVHHYAIHWTSGHADFARVARELGIPNLVDSDGKVLAKGGPDAAKKIIHAVKLWLSVEGNDNWLFIVDGVDSCDALRSFDRPDYIPHKPGGTVVITSRMQESEIIGTDAMEIDGMDEMTALEFLLKSTGRSRAEASANGVVFS
jgi:hypothetical protein